MGTLLGNGVNKAIIDYGRLVGGLALVIAWWRWSVQVWLSHQRESTWGRTSGGSIFTPYLTLASHFAIKLTTSA